MADHFDAAKLLGTPKDRIVQKTVPGGHIGLFMGAHTLKEHWPPIANGLLIPTSVVLQRLHDEAPTDHFTLAWLMRSLRRRSFGMVMLLLALVAIAPGISILAGLLLMIPAF